MYKQKNYSVAVYLRLSKEDGDREESESIANQRKIINNYLKRNENFIFFKEYVDDGYTGANFDRPAFNEMLEDIKNKKINLIIVKSLSRFARNYIDSGEYLQKNFPDNGIRFISILDNYDNYLETVETDFLPIKSVFNEKHCRDTSINVKKSKRRRMQEGIYACNTPPYGYMKDPENKYHLIIDEYPSKIVKMIFELKASGQTIRQIATYLNKKKYKTPAIYFNMKSHKNIKNLDIWKTSSVCKILGNEVYLGKCIRGKTQNISYKSKKRIHISHENRIVNEYMHEAIITQDLFDAAHDYNRFHKKINKEENNYLLKNILYCSKCGGKMYIKRQRNKLTAYCSQNEKSEYLCPNDKKVNYSWLEGQVMDRLIKITKEYINNVTIDDIFLKATEEKINAHIHKKKILEKEINSLSHKIYNLYNDKLNGKNEELYEVEYSKYSKMRNEKKNELEKIDTYILEEKNKYNNEIKREETINRLDEILKHEINIKNIEKLIDRIEINRNSVLIKCGFSNGYKRFFM